jgi:hypothetical protein
MLKARGARVLPKRTITPKLKKNKGFRFHNQKIITWKKIISELGPYSALLL